MKFKNGSSIQLYGPIFIMAKRGNECDDALLSEYFSRKTDLAKIST